MELDLEKSNRLSRMVAGYYKHSGISGEALAAKLDFRSGLKRLFALVGGSTLGWRFSDACPAATALSHHYGVPASTIWSHILEDGVLPDADMAEGLD